MAKIMHFVSSRNREGTRKMSEVYRDIGEMPKGNTHEGHDVRQYNNETRCYTCWERIENPK